MNGWSLSGSQKANHHWQSGNKGDVYPLRPWEWASGYIWGSSARPLVKYRCQNDLTYVACYIKNPFDCTAISNSKEYQHFDVTAVGNYYFRIDLSVKRKPSYLKDIPLYFTGMEIGKQRSNTNRHDGLLSAIADQVIYSKSPEQINSQVNITSMESIHTLTLQDFIPADTEINRVDGYLIDKPLQIYLKVTVDFLNASGIGTVYFFPRLWVDYKYMDQIRLEELPSINSTQWSYYGYGANNQVRLNELVQKVQINATDKYNQLTSDEKSELMRLTNLGISLKVSQIEEKEFDINAQKYGAAN